MKAKIRKGHKFLFTTRKSIQWKNISNEMIVNFKDKYTFIDFKQNKNHLIINTKNGQIDIVFTGEIPFLKFDHYCKDQLVLKCLKEVYACD